MEAYYSVKVIEGLAIIPIGTLDDSTQHEPYIEIFTNSKLQWLYDNGCISERFEKAAVMERIKKFYYLFQNANYKAYCSITCGS